MMGNNFGLFGGFKKAKRLLAKRLLYGDHYKGKEK